MCLFIETICYESGCFQRMEFHNERFNRTRNHFFGIHPEVQLEQILQVPPLLKDETVKCRLTYGAEITDIEYTKYRIRPVMSLQLVEDNAIDYAFKYANREKINALYNLRGQCDDILIVKNGLITDTSYANIVFHNDDKWYSSQYPLLNGTRLESYIRKGVVIPAPIRPGDLSHFSEARIINAMISLENSSSILIENIVF